MCIVYKIYSQFLFRRGALNFFGKKWNFIFQHYCKRFLPSQFLVAVIYKHPLFGVAPQVACGIPFLLVRLRSTLVVNILLVVLLLLFGIAILPSQKTMFPCMELIQILCVCCISNELFTILFREGYVQYLKKYWTFSDFMDR